MSVRAILEDKGYGVSAISGSETIASASDFLSKHRIGAVIVSTPDEEIAGILSERDIVRAISKGGSDVLEKPISEFMTKNVQTSKSGSSILDVMEMMMSGGFRHLPIVEDGKLLGIISIRDVIKYRMDEVEKESEDIKAYIAAG